MGEGKASYGYCKRIITASVNRKQSCHQCQLKEDIWCTILSTTPTPHPRPCPLLLLHTTTWALLFCSRSIMRCSRTCWLPLLVSNNARARQDTTSVSMHTVGA